MERSIDMKTISFFTLSILAVLFVTTGTMQAQKKSMKKPMAVVLSDVQWTAFPDFDGIWFSVLSGDPEKGPYKMFTKIKAGTNFPLHYHSSDDWGVVVQGTFYYQPKGGTRTHLPSGSFFFIPGKSHHTSGTLEGTDVILYEEGSGKSDFVLVKEK